MGFQHMTPERRKAIASQGGSSVPAQNRAFSNPETAKRAGSLGGMATKLKRLDNAADAGDTNE